jgi:hypothetical protein
MVRSSSAFDRNERSCTATSDTAGNALPELGFEASEITASFFGGLLAT